MSVIVNPSNADLVALVAVTASSYHGMPEEVCHVATRGAHPESKSDPTNVRGLPARTHRLQHAGLAVLPEPIDLRAVW